jgi:GNAT superfamily N-acetyltransferase
VEMCYSRIPRVLAKPCAHNTYRRFLAPIWVLPEYQGRGVTSLLLRDGFALADREEQVPPMYLEALPDARVIYEHFGFQGVDGEDTAMIKNPPKSVKTQAK